MSIFEDNGQSVFEDDGQGIYTQSSIAGVGAGQSVFEKDDQGTYTQESMSGNGLGITYPRTVEEDILSMQRGGPRPSFSLDTPGIPEQLGYLGKTSGNADDWREYHAKAKKAKALYEQLRSLGERIPIPNERAKFKKFLGGPGVDESPEYRYRSIVADLNDAANKDLYGSSGYMEYSERRRQGRVDKMEKINQALQDWIDRVKRQYGLNPGGGGGGQGAQEMAEAALAKAKAAQAVAANSGLVPDIQNFFSATVYAEHLAISQDKEAIRQQAVALKAVATQMLQASGQKVPPATKPPEKGEPVTKKSTAIPMSYILGGSALAFGLVLALALKK